jgi:hypothetical protein
MTDEQRKSVALEYLKAFHKAGVTLRRRQRPRPLRRGRAGLFPKWGLADGREAIGRLFADVGGTLKGIAHHYASFNWIFSGANVVVSEGTSHGGHKDGSWRAGMPEWGTSGGVSNESGQQCPAFGVGCRSRASGNSKHYSSSRRTRRRSGRSLTSHPSSVSSRPRRSLRSSRASSGRLPQARSYRLPRGAGATRLRCRTIARPHRARNLPRPRRLRAVVHRLHRQGQRDHEMPCSGYFVRAARGNGNAALSYRYLIS